MEKEEEEEEESWRRRLREEERSVFISRPRIIREIRARFSLFLSSSPSLQTPFLSSSIPFSSASEFPPLPLSSQETFARNFD